jgi:hypothetical protein
LAEHLLFVSDVIHRETHLEESKGETKMKTLKTIILSVGAVALLGASGLYAQTKATADIPFEFTVQSTTLPAGQYTMVAASASHDLMLMRNVETGKAIEVLASSSAAGYRNTSDKNVVVFHRIGDRYFLSDVTTAAVSAHVAPSKLERELSAEGGGQPFAAVIVPAVSVR